MQVSQTDARGSKRVGVEEHLIKFRSSPYLKNMKKFIQSKMHIETTNRATPNAATDPPPAPNIGRKPEVQPPLPLDPPPPDSPVYLNVQVKQEIEDTNYQSGCERSPELVNQEPQSNGDTNTAQEKSPEKKKICRDYIRGTCIRPTCRYAHKYDVSQLEGVYTFCRKYQNSVCTYANCKYVHADVFEERHFYRTGILPPHALAHHKQVLQPPPPPPPPEEPQSDLPPISFTNPPPPLQTEIDKSSLLSIMPSSSVESRGFSDLISPARYTSPLKREWSSIDTYPQCEDMFENGNFKRRRRMKRPFRTAPYPKPLFGDGYVTHVGQHPHMQSIPLGHRNYFGSTSPYPPSYPRYDTSWLTQPTGGLGYSSSCAMGRSPPGCSPHSALSHQTSPVNPFASHQIQGQLQSPLQSMQPMAMNSYNAINVPLDGSSSPGSGYAATGGFSPNRHHDIVTSSDAVSRFSFWPEGGSPSPNAGYVSTSSFSPRRHDAVTSSDTAGRFAFWPEVGVKEESSSSILSNATTYSKCFM